MDSARFSNIIIEQLRAKGSFNLPEIGLFTIVDSPSEFSNEGNLITAPSKRIVFSSSLANESVQLDFPTEFLDEIKGELESKQEVVIPNFGTIRKSGDNFEFIENENFLADPDSFGLSDLNLKEEVGGEDKKIEGIAGEVDGKVGVDAENEVEKMVGEKAEEVGVEDKKNEDVEEKLEEKDKKSEEKVEKNVEKKRVSASQRKIGTVAKILIWTIVIIVVIIILALLIYIFRDTLAPYLQDILYSKEELEIINYKL